MSTWVDMNGHAPYLWREWITSVDHKRIGVMYIVLALVIFSAHGTLIFFVAMPFEN